MTLPGAPNPGGNVLDSGLRGCLEDLKRLFAATIDRGVCLLGFPEALAKEAAAAGRPLRGLVHVR